MGWGSAIGKIFDWLPGKAERCRAKIREIKHEMDAILQDDYSFTAKCHYDKLAKLLAEYEAKLADKG